MGLAQQAVARLFDVYARRPLTIEHLEGLRDDAASRDAWLLFLEEHCERAGVRLIDTRDTSSDSGRK